MERFQGKETSKMMTATPPNRAINTQILHLRSSNCTVKSELSLQGRYFVNTMKTLIHKVAARNGKLGRQFKSCFVTLHRRFRASHASPRWQSILGIQNVSQVSDDVTELKESPENPIPQQQLDELLDFAFECIPDISTEIFEE